MSDRASLIRVLNDPQWCRAIAQFLSTIPVRELTEAEILEIETFVARHRGFRRESS